MISNGHEAQWRFVMKFKFLCVAILAATLVGLSEKTAHAATCKVKARAVGVYYQGQAIRYDVIHGYEATASTSGAVARYGWAYGPQPIILDHYHAVAQGSFGSNWPEANAGVPSTSVIWFAAINVYVGNTVVATHETHTYLGDPG
jgi:hypothetical protein